MTIEKKYYEYLHIHDMVANIVSQMYKDNWRPDYVVGLTRGGLIPAVVMSNVYHIPMETLKVSLRDSDTESESNLWMSEDAYNGKNILILDDINDTGATLDWIINDWQSSCHPSDAHWSNVWGNNVRFAVLIDNLSSNFSRTVDYSAKEINKAEKDVWIVYPWER
jgi:hypoxanthine phosphoribosyltransferase